MIIAGIDEAGRGPLAGPVVACSIIFDDEFFIDGVKDSKLLNEDKRERLYDVIVEKCVSYSVGIVDNSVIDEINILKATMLAMETSLNGALSKSPEKPEKLLIDGNYFRLPEGREKNYNFKTIVKGDSKVFAISCASIIAKVTRDRIMKEMDEEFPVYNFKQHKGYATREHIGLIGKHGLCSIHRSTFCRRILEKNYELEFQTSS